MSSVVVSFDSGTQFIGENLEIIGQQNEANVIEVLFEESETTLSAQSALSDGENEFDMMIDPPVEAQSGTSITIIGGALNDDIDLGVAGSSAVMGLDGEDTIKGGIRNDLIDGGEGNDMLMGGKGNDIVRGGFGDDDLMGNEGNDIVMAGPGDDTISGGLGNDLIEGGLGDDSIMGGPGFDTIKGGAGNDTIVGNDNLDSGDVIMGGSGADMLTGGAGNDVFEFDASEFEADAVDEITDFTKIDDTIRITGVGELGASYNFSTGMISVDGVEAIDIGEGQDLTVTNNGDGEWEIF